MRQAHLTQAVAQGRTNPQNHGLNAIINEFRSCHSFEIISVVPSSGCLGLPNTSNLDAEILSITPDHHNPFKVDFDDQSWSQYVEHLKPLGLSILLNTCNISTGILTLDKN